MERVITKKSVFTPDFLASNGLQFKGNYWGNSNLPYYQIETQLGSLCVVDFSEVYLVRGNCEEKLTRVNTPDNLEQFLNLLN